MGDETVYSYIKDIAQRLRDPRNYGSVSLMVGAGFSKNAKCKGIDNLQLPNWTELAEKMYDELYLFSSNFNNDERAEWEKQKIIKTSGKNVTKLAEEYIANFDRDKLNSLIERSIMDEMFVPGELHIRLLKLRWADVFTTNYDTLLEQTVDHIYKDNNYKIVHSQNDLPGSIKPRIIKLHGSIPYVKPYIISDEDYRTYPVKYSLLVNTVQQAMLETKLCLIGFSGDDPNFQSWLGWLRDNLGDKCPQIYLLDFFDKMSGSEKILLMNKGITLVDLSILVTEYSKNKYQTAISTLLDIVEEFVGEQDVCEKEHADVDFLWETKDKDKYVIEMEKYSSKVVEYINPYILLPKHIRTKYERYFSNHFRLISNDNEIKITPVLLSNIIKILRKCLVILEDNNIKYLETIIQEKPKIEFGEELTCNILLYLLEKYRIDGKIANYRECSDELEKLVEKNTSFYNDFIIEKIHHYISLFDYKNAEKYVERIELSSFVYKIKKAGFYKQLAIYDKADRILQECSAKLAQMKLPENIYASYLGYIDLCYRIGEVPIKKAYYDDRYYNNLYNTRRIIVELKRELTQNLFNESITEEERVTPFNLNQNRPITQTFINRDECLIESFAFILAMERLCLPMFSDQVKFLPRIIEKISLMSKNISWKVHKIILSDNKNVINQFFLRKCILNIGKDDKEMIFDNLILLLQLYNDDGLSRKKYFVSEENILNILSRFVVFMDDAYVIRFIRILSPISSNSGIDLGIKQIINRISTRFNNNIALECQTIIFNEFDPRFHLAQYFGECSFELDPNQANSFYEESVKKIECLNTMIKEEGITQLILLKKNIPIHGYDERIINAIWNNGYHKLPDSIRYYPFIWEQLPHPSTTDFSRLYYKYLLDTEFVKSVTPTGYVINDSRDSVFNYVKFFYQTSVLSKTKCYKVIFDQDLGIKLLYKIHNFIIHEKKLITADIGLFGEKEDCVNKFLYLLELTSFIYILSINIKKIKDIKPQIINIKLELERCGIQTFLYDMMELIENKKYSECMDIFELIILKKNVKFYSAAFIGMQCVLFQLSNGKHRLDFSLESFFKSIKYIDIEYAREIWRYLPTLFQQKYLYGDKHQKYIAKSIKDCIELYEGLANQGERFYLDGLFNCVSTLKQYYVSLNEEKSKITEELNECIEVSKKIKNYEVCNIWK